MNRSRWLVPAIVVIVLLIAAALFWPGGNDQSNQTQPSPHALDQSPQ